MKTDSGAAASLWSYGVLLCGIFACSTSVVLVKASATDPVLIAGLRVAIAAILLSPLAWRDYRRHRTIVTMAHWWRTTLPALVLAAHFISWNFAARMTLAAQATLIVNLVPIAMPFFLWFAAREKINRTEILGTVLAIAGVVVLGVKDAFVPGGDVWGSIVCFGSMLLFAWYLALGRRNRDFPSIWLYVVPVYGQCAAFSLLAAIPWWRTFAVSSLREWTLITALAVVPTIIGHSLLNASMRRLRGQIVGLCNVTQFIFAGVMAFLIFGEEPVLVFYLASALAVAGIATVVIGGSTMVDGRNRNPGLR